MGFPCLTMNNLNKLFHNYPKKKFCCMLNSHDMWNTRNDIFTKLNNIIKVDSGGNFKRNINYTLPFLNTRNGPRIKKEWIKSRILVQHRRVETLYPLGLAIFGLMFLVYSKRLNPKKICIFILPVLGQLGMWYFHSPDTRFASFAFWWIGAGLASIAIKEIMLKKIVIIFPFAILITSFSFHTIDSIGQKKPLLITQPLNLIPKVPTVTQFNMKSGLMVWVPDNGEKCHDSPLPCTQNLDSKLKLIDGNNIIGGYYK